MFAFLMSYLLSSVRAEEVPPPPMGFSLVQFFAPVPVLTLAESVELGVRFPWIGSVLSLTRSCGVLVDVVKTVDRAPATVWEWLWSWFGYTYKEQRFEVHFDFVRLVLLGCCILVLVATLLYLCRVVAVESWSIMLSAWRSAFSTLFQVFYSWARVFRVLASDVEPGSTAATVVPSPSEVPYFVESIRAGSSMVQYAIPDCQIILGVLEKEAFRAFGCGIRVDLPGYDGSFIVTPLHVWSRLPDDIAIRGKNGTINIDRNTVLNGSQSVPRTVHTLDIDVCAFSVSAVEVSRVGATRAVISQLVPTNGAYSRVVGPAGVGSVGTLSSDPHSFGHIIYSGSTEPGFSGAGYILGNGIAGIHCAGGTRNVGYSLRLAYVTLCHLQRLVQEETSEWLEQQLRRRKKKVKLDLTWQDSDSYRIQIDGVYSVVDAQMMKKALGRDIGPHEHSVSYDDEPMDYQPQSSQGNLKTTKAKSSPSSTTSDQATLRQLLSSIDSLNHSLKNMQQPTPSGKPQKGSSGGPTTVALPSTQPESN